MNIINKNNWKRREHFDFFSQFDDPFFGIVSEIDCTVAHKTIKKKGISFFAWYLHKSIWAANQIEEFRFRIDGDAVVIYDKIHASPTLGREDGTFGFSRIEFNEDFYLFEKSLNNEIERIKNTPGLCLSDDSERLDAIHFSSIPWIKFTGIAHAHNIKCGDSIPKITFGKMFNREGQNFMPISVYAHHGLMDGLHVAKFLKTFQQLMDEKNI
jgi:chloramphenicol O-acetyltransferase type A